LTVVPHLVHIAVARVEKRIAAAFHRTASGNEPVRDWLKGLDQEDRKIIGDDLRTLEFGWPIGMPLSRPVVSRKGLWEARSTLPGGRIARVLFCFAGGRMVLLHGFIKKSRTTPARELDLAAKRMREIIR